MINQFVVDTHALAWYLTDNPKLGTNASAALDQQNGVFVLPAIVIAELCWMIEKRRTPIGPVDAVLDAIAADSRFRVIPLTFELVRLTTTLTQFAEMHDRQIVATTLQTAQQTGSDVALLTNDVQIASQDSVRVVW